MSNFTNSIKQWLPPAIYSFAEEIQNKRKHKLFDSYADALNYCSKDGYQNDKLIDVIAYKMADFLQKRTLMKQIDVTATQSFSLLPLIKLMCRQHGKKTFSVLDFGGNLGGHYFSMKDVVNNDLKLNWAVVETPAMAKAGKQFENEELKFFDTIEAARKHLGTVDLVYTSGTLQCVDKPYTYLQMLIDIEARFLFFNRLGLNRSNRDIVTIHHSKLSWNGPSGLPPGVEDQIIKYPFSFISEEKFMAQLNRKYAVRAQFSDDSGIFNVPNQQIIGSGLLTEKKD